MVFAILCRINSGAIDPREGEIADRSTNIDMKPNLLGERPLSLHIGPPDFNVPSKFAES